MTRAVVHADGDDDDAADDDQKQNESSHVFLLRTRGPFLTIRARGRKCKAPRPAAGV
ncbi:MAG: hypothetical protein MZV63_64505 [Marinilabiliales bacterium]|nr:hypothetical protein [Marinilabiliales bacterium]